MAPRPAVIVYQIETEQKTHTGLVALNRLKDYDEGRIRPHEQTLRAKEVHQLDLFLTWGAVIKPLLVAFPPAPALTEWLQTIVTQRLPDETIVLQQSGQIHRLWQVDDPVAVAQAQQIMRDTVPCVYVADGHHRLAAMNLLHREPERSHRPLDNDQLLCAYFDATQLTILDYNRVVTSELDTQTCLSRLALWFAIESLAEPQKPHGRDHITLYLDQHWYGLRWKGPWPEVDGLPLTPHHVFNEYALQSVFGIEDIRNDRRVSYVDGAQGLDGLQQAVDANPQRIGFALPPVDFANLCAHADAGRMLPPKSTFFWPRLPTGLLAANLFTSSGQSPEAARPDTHRP